MLEPLKKLDERSKKYIFVEYAPAEYRLWNPEEKKIKIARDIKFKYAMYKDNISDKERSKRNKNRSKKRKKKKITRIHRSMKIYKVKRRTSGRRKGRR